MGALGLLGALFSGFVGARWSRALGSPHATLVTVPAGVMLVIASGLGVAASSGLLFFRPENLDGKNFIPLGLLVSAGLIIAVFGIVWGIFHGRYIRAAIHLDKRAFRGKGYSLLSKRGWWLARWVPAAVTTIGGLGIAVAFR